MEDINENSMIRSLSAWLNSLLVEHSEINLPALGTFTTVFLQEKVALRGDSKYLIPPSITIGYNASPEILDLKYYTSLEYTLDRELISSFDLKRYAEMNGVSLPELTTVVQSYSTDCMTSLFRGRRVVIWDLGEFYVSEEPDQGLILNYVPSESLLASANRPFESYTEVKLKPGIDFSDLKHIYGDEPDSRQQPIRQLITERITQPTAEEVESVSEIDVMLPIEEDITPTVAPISEGVKSEEKVRRNWLPYLISLILILFLGGGLYFFFSNRGEIPQASIPTIVVDTVTKVVEVSKDTLPISPMIVDSVTVQRGASLNKYAEKYYGYKEYWVYIYFANESRINDPDNIPIGTALLVPDLSYYDLNRDTTTALKEANLWATVILTNRYTDYFEQRPEVKKQLVRD